MQICNTIKNLTFLILLQIKLEWKQIQLCYNINMIQSITGFYMTCLCNALSETVYIETAILGRNNKNKEGNETLLSLKTR